MPVKEEELRIGIDTTGMAALFKRRDDLNALLATEGIASEIGEATEHLVSVILGPYHKRLGVSVGVLEQSLFSLLGHQSGGYPTLRDCRKANWILASNLDEMKMGRPLSPFSVVYRKEWAPFVIVDAQPDVSYHGKPGYRFTYLSMAGYTATEEFKRFTPKKGLFKMHLIMLDLPRKKYTGLKLPESYVGMWSWVLLDPELPFDIFGRAECNESFSKHNRDLLNSRAKPCMQGLPKKKCVTCPVGTEHCPRATHRGLWIVKFCPACKMMGNFKTDEPEAARCIDCDHSAFVSRKKFAIQGKRREHGDEHAGQGREELVQPGAGPA